MRTVSRVYDDPRRNLVALFLLWKILLLVIACCSPGLGYDTSSDLMLSPESDSPSSLPIALQYIVGKLTRWDAIYFVQTSKRGYIFEQEWAFGWGFTRLIAFVATYLKTLGIIRYSGSEGIVAILISHTSHLLAVLCLFSLTRVIFPSCSNKFAFTAAALHILSPAGIFLSAPYAESTCAFLSFLGCISFAKSFPSRGPPTLLHDFLVLVSGIIFGVATTFRSNGILNGLLLLEEAFNTLIGLSNSFCFAGVRRLITTGLGGIFVGAGFIIPQYISYQEYCREPDVEVLRPWCTKSLPSIYTFVQDHYWNVGLFRYWTPSNIPLFLLATPMLVVMGASGIWALRHQSGKSGDTSQQAISPILRNLAVLQSVLTLLTLTTAHVQIISRISSAYPVWIWYIASGLPGRNAHGGRSSPSGKFIRFMIIYAIIQAGLYASFLPPA
ncbi:GPI mannosyltransferase 2 [Tricladium varicosporioides]|nr:GPI mannosyltransferase 2 [Hymenoscyphus varicosporioides]